MRFLAVLFVALFVLAPTQGHATPPDRTGAQRQVAQLEMWGKTLCPNDECKREAERLAHAIPPVASKYVAAGCLDVETPACKPLRAQLLEIADGIDAWARKFGTMAAKK